MGVEIEYKLRAESGEQLSSAYQRLKACGQVGNARMIAMHTRYFDTQSRDLQSRKWTLRIRQENEKQVLTFKTPGENYHRGEWNLERLSDSPVPEPEELAALVAAGAPEDLLHLSGFCAVCRAEFIRNCTMLTLDDGTRIELAADCGKLYGQTECAQFYELELELYGGSEQHLSQLAKLAGLPEEPRSKAARALCLK